jgi:predicted metal-dependent hydrolase
MRALRQILFGKTAPAPPPDCISVDIEGTTYDVFLKRHAKARRMVLRLARDGRSFALTLPKRQSLTSAQAFIATSKLWMQNTLAQRGPDVPQGELASLALRGETIAIVATGKLRGLTTYDAAAKTLAVPGDAAHRTRKVQDWLKTEALADLKQSSQHYASMMECRYIKISVRDQKSRWGSCAANGALSYSWRLIMAPPYVLDYVAAHEVAHLREMNHGPRFWRLVLTHCKHTRAAQSWLKAQGHKLHHVM